MNNIKLGSSVKSYSSVAGGRAAVEAIYGLLKGAPVSETTAAPVFIMSPDPDYLAHRLSSPP